MATKRQFPALDLRGLAVFLFAACLGAILPARSASALEHVTVRLDWLPRAYQSVLYLAAKNGYFKNEGLEVEIFDGKGTIATIQAIAGGSDTIGLASLTDAAIAVTKGIPIVSVACIIQTDPDSLVSLKGSGIDKPKDVEGKRMGIVPGANAERIFRAFAAKTNIDVSKINFVSLSIATENPMLLQGNIDYIAAWAPTDALRIARQKPIEPPILFADYGVNALAIGVIVTKETAEKRGDMVRGFLKAMVHAADDMEKNPDAAIDALLAARPDQDRGILVEENKLTQRYYHTPNTKGHVFGWMAPADWAQTGNIMKNYLGVTADFNVSDFYTDKFLPQQ